MPLLIFVHADGREERLEAAPGMTVLDCALHYGIAGVRGQCGGAATCGTCHCSVLGSWIYRVPPPREEEVELLEYLEDADAHSRLACQIPMTRALDGLRVQWQGAGPTEGAA